MPMKKYLYNIAMVVIIATIAISLTSCDKDSDLEMSDLEGAWKLQSSSGYGETKQYDEERWTYVKLMSNGTFVEVDHKYDGDCSVQTGECWVDSKTRTLNVRQQSYKTTDPYSIPLTGTTVGMEIVEKTDNKMTLRTLGVTATYVRVSNSEFEQKYATVMNIISSYLSY